MCSPTFLPDDVYKQATGAELSDLNPAVPEYLPEPSGQKIDGSYRALCERFPKLAARYLPGGVPDGTPFDNGPRHIQ
jgi:hypothetical protein